MKVNLSIARFIKEFTEIVSIPAWTYVINRSLEIAGGLLSEKANISQAIILFGYFNMIDFFASFKKNIEYYWKIIL